MKTMSFPVSWRTLLVVFAAIFQSHQSWCQDVITLPWHTVELADGSFAVPCNDGIKKSIRQQEERLEIVLKWFRDNYLPVP